MISLIKLVKNGRQKKKRSIRLAALAGSPQRKGICAKIYTTSPKKPNSAVRKVAKVRLSNGSYVIAGIPGIGFKIIQYSNVLVRGGRLPDVPGVKYKLIRGPYDFKDCEFFLDTGHGRRKRRSKFGTSLEATRSKYIGSIRKAIKRTPYKTFINSKKG